MRRGWFIAALCVVASAVRPAAAVSCTAYASGIVFAVYSGLRVDVTGTITVTCTSGTAYHIGLNAGNTPGATITNRQMFGGEGGQNSLGYQLFNDAARTINWGDSSGTNWVTGTGSGSAQQYTIYARIPANESAPQGSYTDTITASVTGSFTTATAQFSVTATYAPGCSVAAGDLAFGAYSGASINSTSTIAVICSPGTKYDIGLSAGTSTGATVTNRSMTGPDGVLLHYGLFQDARRSQNWGNTPGVDTESGSGNGKLRPTIVFGQLPGGQSAPPGAYSDTITVTVTY
jgi:spore coat protein U-like protein